MNYRLIIIILFSLLLHNCEQSTFGNSKKIDLDFESRYKNSGFALIYNKQFKKIKKLESRSLNIYHKSLKKDQLLKLQIQKTGNI